ncbi:H-2 class I histocompatibility antigen, K-D alpha chain-like isoform 3-T3 [Clarias gariepinus]
MLHGSAVTKVLLLLTIYVHLSSADVHTLQFFFTEVTEVNFPEFSLVGLLDGEQIVYYNSNNRTMIPKTDWIKKVKSDDPGFWDSLTLRAQSEQEWFKDHMTTVMQSFNQTEGVHTAQFMFGCELDDDGITRGHSQYGYDGEDFISLDMKTVTWTAAHDGALTTKHIWESTGHEAEYCKDYLKFECIESLKKFLIYGNETLKRKAVPMLLVFKKRSPSPEVVCHATGFFPKAVMITWQKDGEDVHEDVELRETLHNQDGSFQKRSILKVPAEELQKHTYTCVVQHSSLEKELVREVPKGGGSIAIITAVVAALCVLNSIVFVGIVVWKQKVRKEADVKKGLFISDK